MGNGAYLVNGQNADGVHKSAMAWYSDLNRSRDGSQPDAFASLSGVAQGHFVQWEGQQISGTFVDGNVLTVNIIADAQVHGFGTAVGSAKNNFQSYQVFKDDNRSVFEKDGYNYETIYYCV